MFLICVETRDPIVVILILMFAIRETGLLQLLMLEQKYPIITVMLVLDLACVVYDLNVNYKNLYNWRIKLMSSKSILCI